LRKVYYGLAVPCSKGVGGGGRVGIFIPPKLSI
jgi:hypothetical protein